MKYIFFEVSSVRLKIIFSYFLSIFLSWKLCIIMMMWVWFDRGGGRGRYGLKITLRYLQDISWYITCIEWVKYPNIFDQIPRSWYCDTICRHDYWYFYKILTQWDFWSIIIMNIDVMTTSVKASIGTSATSLVSSEKLHHFTVMWPLKRQRRHFITYHNTTMSRI